MLEDTNSLDGAHLILVLIHVYIEEICKCNEIVSSIKSHAILVLIIIISIRGRIICLKNSKITVKISA